MPLSKSPTSSNAPLSPPLATSSSSRDLVTSAGNDVIVRPHSPDMTTSVRAVNVRPMHVGSAQHHQSPSMNSSNVLTRRMNTMEQPPQHKLQQRRSNSIKSSSSAGGNGELTSSSSHSQPHPQPSNSSHPSAPAAFSLAFSDAILEKQFRAYLFHKRLAPLRVMLPLLVIVFVLLSVYDQQYLAKEKVQLVSILRYGAQVPIAVIWYLVTFTDRYRDINQTLNSITALIVGGINVALTVVGAEPDHGPQMLYSFLVFMFLQLRVLYASAVCWALFPAWIICVHYYVPEYDNLLVSSGYMLAANLTLMIACYFVESWLRLDFFRHHLVILEERKTHDLLATLLPERITEQLRNLMMSGLDSHDELIAEDHPSVSILFSDIVGFTAYSATISAREVVGFLGNLYTVLDYLTTEHQILKIETIGDAYFCASGVLEPRDDHVTLLANFAFAMLSTIRKFKLKGGRELRMRIGMHTGRVIAGVVGLKVPRFHLFGNCVALASLMEQTGVPDRIHVSTDVATDLSRWTDEQGREMYALEPRVDPQDEALALLAKRNSMETFWLTEGRGSIEHEMGLAGNMLVMQQLHSPGGALMPASPQKGAITAGGGGDGGSNLNTLPVHLSAFTQGGSLRAKPIIQQAAPPRSPLPPIPVANSEQGSVVSSSSPTPSASPVAEQRSINPMHSANQSVNTSVSPPPRQLSVLIGAEHAQSRSDLIDSDDDAASYPAPQRSPSSLGDRQFV